MDNFLNLQNKREMFWDDYLVDQSLSTTSCVLEPISAEPQILKWLDDMVTSYPCIIKVGDEFRMYYVGGYITTDVMTDDADTYHLSVKLLVSKDGINWDMPDIPGKKDGIVIDKVLDNFYVFIDENPSCLPEEKFKALSSGYYIDGQYGLYLLTSSDGYKFSPVRILTDKGTFDSCNTLHYIDGRYICYVRTWHDYTPEKDRPKNLMNDFFDIPSPDKEKCQMRSISVLYSDDCKNWDGPYELQYDDDLDHQMYTNNAQAYDRAPHIIIGFPTRYCQRERWNENFNQMGGLKRRLHTYNSVNPREGVSITDCLFMFSRDTKNFHRFSEAFMRPGYENDFNWVYGDCYPAFGLVDSGKEYYMMYTIEHHLNLDSPHPLCMYKVRKDGFACQKADSKEQILVTKPFVFEGSVLHLNMSTSAYGYIYVDVLDENGNELSKKESFEIFGNTIDRKVVFDDGEDFSKYQGKPIRLRFRMRDAKLYSMKFE